jgi:hypothetical protein
MRASVLGPVLRAYDLDAARTRFDHQRRPLQGTDIVTRGFNGDLARWRLPKVPSSQDLVRMIGRMVPRLPFRFDEDSGRLASKIKARRYGQHTQLASKICCKTAMSQNQHRRLVDQSP